MNKKLNDALNEISDRHLEEAEQYQKSRFPWWMGAVAAILALILVISGLPGSLTEPDLQVPVITRPARPAVPDPTGIPDPNSLNLANLLSAPQYPEMVAKPNQSDYTDSWEYQAQLTAWRQSCTAQYSQPKGYADSLTPFFQESIRQFLNAEENSAYSPVNVYMALAMLAETTDGNSRQQVLDLLGLDSIEALREQVRHVWNAHYSDDGETTLLLGSSLWLDEAFSFHQKTVDRLANNYYASSFRGDLGTAAMDQHLQTWLDANTGGLLQEQASNVTLDPSTVFTLATTVYFTAGWEKEFFEQNNREMLFHCEDYDLSTTFMRQTFKGHTYYWGENFGAIQLDLSGNNAMWLILPDEGYSVADILASNDYLRLTMNPDSWQNRGTYEVRLQLPKFDVTSNTDLATGLKAMGIHDVFNPGTSDFTPLTDTAGLFMSGATHAARVAIDEEGCVAAAFTVFTYGATFVPPEYEIIDFTLDRPFLFVVSSRDDLPLFAGVVAEP